MGGVDLTGIYRRCNFKKGLLGTTKFNIFVSILYYIILF